MPKKRSRRRLLFFTQASVIAALYTVLTFAFGSVSFGVVQFRVSEMLTVLPCFTPAAIPGLFVGCLLSNLLGTALWADVLFGSLATLAAALLSHLFRKHRLLVPLPPVIVNALVVPFVLRYAYGTPGLLPVLALSVGVGQFVCCYGLGIPFMKLLERVGVAKILEQRDQVL